MSHKVNDNWAEHLLDFAEPHKECRVCEGLGTYIQGGKAVWCTCRDSEDTTEEYLENVYE